jgi:hypothetical protein
MYFLRCPCETRMTAVPRKHGIPEEGLILPSEHSPRPSATITSAPAIPVAHGSSGRGSGSSVLLVSTLSLALAVFLSLPSMIHREDYPPSGLDFSHLSHKSGNRQFSPRRGKRSNAKHSSIPFKQRLIFAHRAGMSPPPIIPPPASPLSVCGAWAS